MNDPENINLSSQIIFRDQMEFKNSDPIKYVIRGDPISWKRPGRNQLHIYDAQKKQKLNFQLQLQAQHGSKILYGGPLALVAYFFVALPKTSKKQQDALANKPYPYTPDLDNYVKFIQDTCQGILYENDKAICIISASKKYCYHPRTEFYILELK